MNAFYWVAALLTLNLIVCAALILTSQNRRMEKHREYMREEL